MPTIVDFPTIVKDAMDVFGDLFANEPARRHFAEYLTGLMVAEKKTVSGINGAFVVTTDQSCLHRWLNEVTWDVKALNDRRLDRKSTRLNSSHLGISYAVFCLQKKKTTKLTRHKHI